MRKSEIDDLLATMLESHDNVSDLNVTVDRPLQVEVVRRAGGGAGRSAHREPHAVPDRDVRAEPDQRRPPADRDLLTTRLLRLSYYLPGRGPLPRQHLLPARQLSRSCSGSSRRNIPTSSAQAAGRLQEDAEEKNGLILVTGATGSGKSTSLAALLNEINATKSIHIVTLEDPVEFVHPNRKATFNQRELGTDFDSFANGLRAALRQAPKIILVGEMRDRETAEMALKAAETGHLVLSTLHTVNAGQAINRVVGMFDKDEEKQIRQRLADTLRWVVGQRLVPKVGGGRWAVHDILANTIRSNELILQGEPEGKTFYEIQEVGEPFGMMTFDQSLLRSYEHGLVTEDTAVNYSTRKAVVQRGIDTIKQKRGRKDDRRRGPQARPRLQSLGVRARGRSERRERPARASRPAWRSSARTRRSARPS